MSGQIFIPHQVLEGTSRFLRRRGQSGKEGLVLWAGRIDSDSNASVLMHITAGGSWTMGVHLDFQQLIKLTQFMSDHNLILVAQVHNHPDRVPHSQGDDENPASHRTGYVSIVVPEMALQGLDLFDCYAYEYQSRLKWREWDANERQERFNVLPKSARI